MLTDRETHAANLHFRERAIRHRLQDVFGMSISEKLLNAIRHRRFDGLRLVARSFGNLLVRCDRARINLLASAMDLETDRNINALGG